MFAIRANHDTQTNYLYQWSEEVIEKARNRGYKVDRIEGKDLNEKSLRSRIRNRKPRIIFYNGHGSRTSLYDNGKKAFINIGSADVFSGTVTFTRACDALAELGPAAVEKGCKAFLGYRRSFWLVRQHKWECQPTKDPAAKPILEGSNTAMLELIKGKCVEEAVAKTREHANKAVMDLIYSKEPTAPATLQALIANDSAFGYAGDPKAVA